MNVLVMGGSRFMGLATVRELLARGHSVTVFNRGTRAVEWPSPVTEMRGDRNDPQALKQLGTQAFEGVIDLSAYTGEQTRLLLAAPGMKDVPQWVHCSSGAVYAPQPILPWKENGPMGPWSMWGQYAVDKLDGERSLQTLRSANLATTALRLPFVLGPANYVDREEFVFNRLLDDATILLPGDGQAVVQFVSTRQVAQAMVGALETFAGGGWRVYNIASPGFCSLEGFVQICAGIVHKEPNVRTVGGGATGGAGEVFNGGNAVFPFPNANYVLDLDAAGQAGIAPQAETLNDMLVDAFEFLQADPARRKWARTPAEIRHLKENA